MKVFPFKLNGIKKNTQIEKLQIGWRLTKEELLKEQAQRDTKGVLQIENETVCAIHWQFKQKFIYQCEKKNLLKLKVLFLYKKIFSVQSSTFF